MTTPPPLSPLSLTGKQWRFHSQTEREALLYAQRLQIPEPVAQILINRGISLEEAENFLDPRLRSLMPDPFHLLDMDKAVARIAQAIINQEKVAVFGDYDVDGATSSALLIRYFHHLGLPLHLYVPDRLKEGYGPNVQAFQHLKDKGCQLVITVDCGITAHEPLQQAQEMGLDVVVLDHHIGEPDLPPAAAVVNPNRLDDPSELGYLAAVGVTYLTLVALTKHLKEISYFEKQQLPPPDLLSLLDIVALGTVCDVVPLVGLNRCFVTQGLKIMRQQRTLGLKVLSEIARQDEAPNAYHLGFLLGPRINAGGRVGQSELGAKLLSTRSPEEAISIARQLDSYNEERKLLEDHVLQEATQQAEAAGERSLVLAAGDHWHPGVIGIVAGRLKERYSRPALVISFDENGIGKGSARSVSGLHFGNIVIKARQLGLLVNGGGHGMAAGLTVTRDQYADLVAFLETEIATCLARDNIKPTLRLEGCLPASFVTIPFLKHLETLAPFGAGNPQPRFCLENVLLHKVEILKEKHIRCYIGAPTLSKPIRAMAFRAMETGLGEHLLSLQNRPSHVACTLKLNTWGGYTSAQAIVEDVMPASADTALSPEAARLETSF